MSAGPSAIESERLSERAAHASYGSIVVLAVILALEGSSADPGEVIASVLGAALATALAELYADYIGATIRERRHLTGPERRAAARNVAAGFAAAILPGAFFVLASADAISLDAAFDAAKWTGVGVLGAYAVIANRVAGLPIAHSIAVGLGFAVIGAALVLLKVLIG